MITLAFSLVARLLFIELPDLFIWTALVDLILMAGFYFVVKFNPIPKWEIALSLLTAFIAETLRDLVSKEAFSDFKLPLTITLGVTEYCDHNDNALSMTCRQSSI